MYTDLRKCIRSRTLVERLWYWYELLQLIVTPLRSLPETDKLQGRDGLYRVAGADPEISFGGPRGAEVERHRREDRGAEGVGRGCPSPHRGRGLGRGLCPLPRKIFNIAL